MSARELIEQEYKGPFNGDTTAQAAERVIERLQRDCATLAANYDAQERRAKAAEAQVIELQQDAQARMHWLDEGEKERYRDRLDRMVAALILQEGVMPDIGWPEWVTTAKAALAAIDAAVEERK